MLVMTNQGLIFTSETYRQARLSRDARFDGRFFTAVKTTGVFCRSICPATPPKEKNVEYYPSAVAAANAGYRPCLRCRPDSAPGSPAWRGVDTTLERAIRLIDQGALHDGSLQSLAARLGISDRYLRRLFDKYLGVSPKTFALYQQCLFAKQLLHQTRLPITQVALASGFGSIRRFNDCFKAQMGLTPSHVRKFEPSEPLSGLRLKLFYRPPYRWRDMQKFLSARFIPGLEWVDENSYGRTFTWLNASGRFTAVHIEGGNRFDVSIELSNLAPLKAVVNNIRRVLDLDADMATVEHHLRHTLSPELELRSGIRLPGTWSMFEAGVRAVLGQQVSVAAARRLVTELVTELGQTLAGKNYFPSARVIAQSELDFLKMPGSRKQSLHNLARHYLSDGAPDNPEPWLALKGIGPWTIDYARMRGLSDPDVYLGGDLGIKKALKRANAAFDPALASPWRSYLTMQLWNQL